MKNKRLLQTLALITVSGGIFYTPVCAADSGDWLVRLRALRVSPNDNSDAVSTIPGSSVSVDSDNTVELDFTYFITRKLGIEAILGTSKHNIYGEGSIKGLGKIANVRTLPPTFTLQYHFEPDEMIRPYAGIGINYTKFYDQNSTSSLEGALGPTSVNLDDSWGLSGQIGVDVMLNEDWFINFDAKYIRINTTATINSGGTVRNVNVDINPWFLGVGVGKQF